MFDLSKIYWPNETQKLCKLQNFVKRNFELETRGAAPKTKEERIFGNCFYQTFLRYKFLVAATKLSFSKRSHREGAIALQMNFIVHKPIPMIPIEVGEYLNF